MKNILDGMDGKRSWNKKSADGIKFGKRGKPEKNPKKTVLSATLLISRF